MNLSLVPQEVGLTADPTLFLPVRASFASVSSRGLVVVDATQEEWDAAIAAATVSQLAAYQSYHESIAHEA